MVTLVSPGFIDTPMSRKVTEPKPFLMRRRYGRHDHQPPHRRAATRTIVVPWQFAGDPRHHRSSAALCAALGPGALMTAAPTLRPNRDCWRG